MKRQHLLFGLLFSTAAFAQQDSLKPKPAPAQKSAAVTIVGVNNGANQLALIGNVSDTSHINTQTALLFNMSNGPITGMQLSGVVNITTDSISGAQFSGVGNMAQAASGVQVAGVMNMTNHTATAVQAAGSFNYAGQLNGIQLAGTGNIVAGKARGGQFSGAFNFAGKESEVFQVAGALNYAQHIRGAQIAGALNIANGDVYGVQISGAVNYARKVKGLQLGVFNFADSVQGASIGVFSFVRHGYHKLEISSSESMLFNTSFHTGSHLFHNIIGFGITQRNNDTYWSYHYGIGSAIKLTKRMDMVIDLTGHHVSRNSFNERVSELVRLEPLVDFHITKNISVFAGPALNVFVYDIQGMAGSESMAGFVPFDFYNQTFDNRWTVRAWAGGKIGLRFF
ncbi:MAG: hypothetical protein MUC87_19005 [Bacteroidia bacterium]|jgi:hypothetical protein|nr:hypothetical protein [Bacteroidia bacterium]